MIARCRESDVVAEELSEALSLANMRETATAGELRDASTRLAEAMARAEAAALEAEVCGCGGVGGGVV